MALKYQSSRTLLLCLTITTLLSGTANGLDVSTTDQNCVTLDKYLMKIVCVCDTKSCAKLSFNWPHRPAQAFLVESSRAGTRFAVSEIGNSSSQARTRGTVNLNINSSQQAILGWGGAITDAAAINIKSLPHELGSKLIESYYGGEGLQYNFARVPIAGSDFSTRPYSYDDSAIPDYNLTHWSLTEEDLHFKIPVIQKAKELTNSTGVELKLFASPWSPPRWMKTNKDFRRGYLIDEDEIYRSYADYLVKFYEAYKAHGLTLWGATVQNEPMAAFLPTYYFNSLQLGNSQAIKLISRYLGPALQARGYTKKNFKLMVGDDSLGFINMQVPAIMRDPGVQKYVSGLAFHWYTSGVVVPYDSLTKVVDAIRDHIEFVIMSEACTGSMVGTKHVDLGSWDRGESYAIDIIEDLRRQTGAWIDWNIALNISGGPNWVNNVVDSPIIVDTTGEKFYKQPMFYILAHFSKFFRPGSTYIQPEVIGTGLDSSQIMFAAAYLEESKHVVVNVLNRSDKAKNFTLKIFGVERILTVAVKPRSINTVVVKL